MAGLHESSGEVVVIMDGDLQHSPQEIHPLFLRCRADLIWYPGAEGTDMRAPLFDDSLLGSPTHSCVGCPAARCKTWADSRQFAADRSISLAASPWPIASHS
ncbi:MAG: hypothetical protein EXS17_07230 [Phycisphaerales bacterium]|nr:hypothetical protein [Phycisphaerales bacterium]